VEKSVTLKDGTEVVVRPVSLDDRARSLEFFRELPADDRIYLRADVTRPEIVDRRFQHLEVGELFWLVAVENDRIVADGVLEREAREWKGHLAEIRLFVAADHRQRGLGTLMSRELYRIALEEKIEEIVVRVMRPQKAARQIVERLGFRKDVVLTDYVRDRENVKQDLIVMRCDIEALWKEIERHLADSDWQRTR